MTPTPWRRKSFDDAQVLILGASEQSDRNPLVATFTGPDREDNAAATLRAVNAHDALVADVKRWKAAHMDALRRGDRLLMENDELRRQRDAVKETQ